jgi:PPM family protein phosphatase
VTLNTTYAGLTDIGRVRTTNEDRWFADPAMGLYVVADGMGGEYSGGLASKLVVETLPNLLKRSLANHADLSDGSVQECVRVQLCRLSETIREESRDQPGLDGMGSTVVAALVRDQRALIAHLGDSRAYRLREDRLEQLTRDHSIVQLLIDAGELSPDQALTHPARGQLRRYVGMDGEPLPEVRVLDLAAGDALLLCSDGVTGMLDDHSIESLLSEHADAESACRSLIDAALSAGGEDNVTCLVLRLKDAGNQL